MGTEQRDYDKANSDERFNDEVGQFSGSPQRDHNWSVDSVQPLMSDAGGAAIELAASVSPGMSVVGRDAGSIGTVKEVGATAVLVDRSMARDIWVPFDMITSAVENRVVIDVMADNIDDMGWEKPPLLGGDANSGAGNIA